MTAWKLWEKTLLIGAGTGMDNTGHIVLQYNTGGLVLQYQPSSIVLQKVMIPIHIGIVTFSESSNTEYWAILENPNKWVAKN